MFRKTKSKLAVLLSMALCVSMMASAGSVFALDGELSGQETYSISEAYEYPTLQNSSEWLAFETNAQKLDACQVPIEIVQNMTTDALVDTVLNHPMYMNIYAFNTYAQGFQTMLSNSNAVKELTLRSDAGESLLTKYRSLNGVMSRNSSSVFELANIEILLAQPEIYNWIEDSSAKSIQDEIYEAYDYRTSNPDKFGVTATAFYEAIAEQPESSSAKVYGSISTRDSTATVKTPAGTSVDVIIRTTELSSAEIADINSYVADTYPNATKLRNPTTKYNCHSYAWYSTSSTNKYWMNYPDAYMSDGSYIPDIHVSKGSKLYYAEYDNEHSGIITERKQGPIAPDAYSVVTVESKWGAWGLMRHSAQDCPYYFTDTDQWLYAYKR